MSTIETIPTIETPAYFNYDDAVYTTYESPVKVEARNQLIIDYANFLLKNSEMLGSCYNKDSNAACLEILHNSAMAFAKSKTSSNSM